MTNIHDSGRWTEHVSRSAPYLRKLRHEEEIGRVLGMLRQFHTHALAWASVTLRRERVRGRERLYFY